MKHYGEFEIAANAPLAPDIRDVTVLCPAAAQGARAGQFAQVYTGRGELLLPRPISICEVTGDGLRFVFRVAGAGTRAIAHMRPGRKLRLIAPLGNGFDLTAAGRVAVVGGGIGAPPLLELVKRLKADNPSRAVHAFLGFRGEPFLINDFERAGAKVYLSTDDGLEGFRGPVTEHIEHTGLTFGHIYACGPKPMLESLTALAKRHGSRLDVSLEERMACGVGACVGCAVKVARGREEAYERVCADGPVYDAANVLWE